MRTMSGVTSTVEWPIWPSYSSGRPPALTLFDSCKRDISLLFFYAARWWGARHVRLLAAKSVLRRVFESAEGRASV